jgi:hypothetical protein
VRDTSAALCAEFTAAESACFGPWCALLDGHKKPGPAAVVASQEALHEAAGRLRDWCLADPAEAEAERRDLMARQAGGQLAADAAVRAHRTRQDRDRIRTEWVTARWHIICQRDALTCGLGWPHRGELVTVSTWRHGHAGARVPVAGEGIYLHSFDIYNAGHQVWVPALSARRHEGTVMVRWLAGDDDGPLGPPDPAGAIGLRLQDAPARLLPVPLMRWPGPADAGLDIPAPDVRAEPYALFSPADLPAPAPAPAAAPRNHGGQGARGRLQRVSVPAEDDLTLF